MSKIMLVEDDNSLREIYSIRLTAEGYTIVSAGDGEEALAVAVRERPDLIISDVMMPKISGFDMLDILRSTPETKDIKVIMMTALSSEDQRVRGESLGANRYLVKSQVGIEDVVNVVHEMLGDRASDGTINPTTPENDPAPVAANGPAAMPAPQAPAQAMPQTPGEVPQAPAMPAAPMQAQAAPLQAQAAPTQANPMPSAPAQAYQPNPGAVSPDNNPAAMPVQPNAAQ